MKARVYLRGNEVTGLEGYQDNKVVHLPDRICDISILKDTGRTYFEMDHEYNVPAIFTDIVDEITFRPIINVDPDHGLVREKGEYKLENSTAVAVVDGDDRELNVNISKAKSMEEVRALYKAIRSGTICPFLPYDGPYSGMSKQELEREIENQKVNISVFNDLLSEKDAQIVDLKESIADKKQAIEDLQEERNKLQQEKEALNQAWLKGINDLREFLSGYKIGLFSNKQIQKMLLKLLANQ